MIENKFTFYELSRFLMPILGLMEISEVINGFEKVLHTKIDHIDKLYDYFNKHKVSFEEFEIIIRDLKTNNEGHIHIKLDFRITNKWYYNFQNPEKKVIKAIQQICKKQISQLEFRTLRHTFFETIKNERKEQVVYFYYDSIAFNNPDDEDGRRISPLIIATSTNDRYRFIEFNFFALSYEQSNGHVQLKDNWWELMKYYYS